MRPTLVPIALAALAALPSAAQAQVSVSPAQVNARVQTGQRLPPLSLLNQSSRPVDVQIVASPTGQKLTGFPDFTLDRSALASGRRMLSVSPSSMRVPARSSRRVAVTVGRRPGAAPGAYAVVVFTAKPVTGRARTSRVLSQVRLSAPILMQFPGRARRTGDISGMRAMATDHHGVGVGVIARGTGNLHVRAGGTLVVRGPGGTTSKVAIAPATVLPGAGRELIADLPAGRPAGTYTATANLRIGRSRATKRMQFRLSGTDQLAAPDPAIPALVADRRGDHVHVSGDVANRGSAALSATLVVAGRSESGRAVTRRVSLDGVAAGAEAQISLDLADAKHELTGVDASVVRDEATLVARSAAVREPQSQISVWNRLADWAAQHVRFLLAVFGGLTLVLLTALAVVVRRLGRRTARPA